MAQLDHRLAMAVPNVLAQQAQVTQNNALNAQALGQGFDAVYRGMEAPLRRNVLQAQAGSMNLEQTRAEQQMLGGVLDNLANSQNLAQDWTRARDFLISNGVFEPSELPENPDEQTLQSLAVIAHSPAEQLTDYQRQVNDLNSPDPMRRQAAAIARGIIPGAENESYTLSPGQTRVVNGEVVAALPPDPKGIKPFTDVNGNVWDLNTGTMVEGIQGPVEKPEGPDLTAQAGLRKEWQQLNKTFVETRDAFTKIQDAATNPSPASDMSLIFNYMKMLDPGSVVREGEYANAQQAGSVPTRVIALYNNAIDGKLLTGEQRADFVGVAKRIYDGQLDTYNQNLGRYRGIAAAGGLDVNSTIPDLSLAPEVDLSQVGTETGGGIAGENSQGVPVGFILDMGDGKRKQKQADGSWKDLN